MSAVRLFAVASVLGVTALCLAFSSGEGAAAETFAVSAQQIDDYKPVYATVRSKDVIAARVRTPGTIATLKVQRGDEVKPGQVLALVTDPKIALKTKSIDAQILAIQSRIETAKAELDRSMTLKEKGVSPQSRVDQAQTAYDVAVNELKAAQAERSVALTQSEEGEVLAPAAGRILQVPVTEGSVVMSGESIATIAANGYLLRLELPERHAQFMRLGDTVRLAGRGALSDEAKLTEGKIVMVYPELNNGRVIADAEVSGLGSYFVGERVSVLISAGKREAFVVPQSYLFKRYGLDYVRVTQADGSTADVVVQPGRALGGDADRIEILAGVKAGDTLVQP